MLLHILASCLLSFTYAISLPENRRACKNQDITFIPDEYEYYEEAFELSFDSSLSVNNVPITRIVEEECGLREKESMLSWGGRRKRSVIGKGVRHLSRLLHILYHHGQKLFKPELLHRITHVLTKMNSPKSKLAKASVGTAYTFYKLIWTDMDSILKEAKDDSSFEAVLENAMRGSIQLLIQSGKMTELILNEPSVLEKIQRRLPVENAKLLEMVEATNVMCHQGHRDSQVVIFMKLKIPKISKITAKTCDDIGVVANRTYQYYDLPATTFARNGKQYEVETSDCFLENFMFCRPAAITPAECHMENLEKCELVKQDLHKNFARELSVGFAIYGKVTQIITKRGELYDEWRVRPNVLYHLIPRNNEEVDFGSQPLKQDTDYEDTVIKMMA